MSEWVKLCSRKDLPAEGEAKEFSAGSNTVCVATIDGKPLALDNACPHRGGPLSEGTIESGKIVCPWHQWEFDLATGAGTDAGAKVAAYPLRQDDDNVMIEI